MTLESFHVIVARGFIVMGSRIKSALFFLFISFLNVAHPSQCKQPLVYQDVASKLVSGTSMSEIKRLIEREGVSFQLNSNDKRTIPLTRTIIDKYSSIQDAEITSFFEVIANNYCNTNDNYLRFSGSDTIGEELMPLLAVGFLKNLGFDETSLDYIRKERLFRINGRKASDETTYRIEIISQGSLVGFEQLRSDNIGLRPDLVMSSVKADSAEIQQQVIHGYGRLVETPIAGDQIWIIVNRLNPMTEIFSSHLQKLIANPQGGWRQLGTTFSFSFSIEDKQDVIICGRDEKSGTHAEVVVMTGLSFKPNIEPFQGGHREVSECVSRNITSIGYVAKPFVGNAKALHVIEDGTSQIAPYSRTLYLYHPELARLMSAKQRNVRQFIEFAKSPKGQRIVQDAKFDPIGTVESTVEQTSSETDWCKGDKIAHADLIKNFYFKEESDAPYEVGSSVRTGAVGHNDKIVIRAFTDISGAADYNLTLSARRAKSARIRIVDRNEVSILGSVGCGMRISGNETAAGRQNNRVAEIWKIHD